MKVLEICIRRQHIASKKGFHMEKSNPVAVITGAAQGIGRRTAEILAERDYFLALNDLGEPADTLGTARATGTQADAFLGDISNEAFVERFASSVFDRWGRMDVLVNNAGISFIAPAEEISARDFRRVLEVNLVAPFLLSKAFGRIMLRQKRGSIVNVSSITGLAGVTDRSAYNDIARAIAFLADPIESAFINGHTLVVDGGWPPTPAGTPSASATANNHLECGSSAAALPKQPTTPYCTRVQHVPRTSTARHSLTNAHPRLKLENVVVSLVPEWRNWQTR
jgi:NAD(P)-dependent dehydrogenase (short-subunit alcohol dehydrogenase family)